MTLVRVAASDDHCVLGDHIRLANNPWLRLRGLMGVRTLSVGQGMLFPHTNAVHGFFMLIPLRLIYLGRSGAILRITELRPWSLGPIVRGAYWVLEIPLEASVEGLIPGMRLSWTS